MVASTTLINHDLSVWLTKPAPSPPTVYWPNIRWRQWERSSRTLLVWIAFWALCFFYLIPIGAVQVCLVFCVLVCSVSFVLWLCCSPSPCDLLQCLCSTKGTLLHSRHGSMCFVPCPAGNRERAAAGEVPAVQAAAGHPVH